MKINLDEDTAKSIVSLQTSPHFNKVLSALANYCEKQMEALVKNDMSDENMRELRAEIRALSYVLELPEKAKTKLTPR